MFVQVYDVLSLITSVPKGSDYTAKEQKYVKTLEYKKFESVLCLINDQTKIPYAEYAIFKQNYTTNSFEFVSNIVNCESNSYHTVIDSTDDSLILNALTPECLCNYILDNCKKRYILLSLNYGSNLHDSAHQAGILIDNGNKIIYMIDPNGKSDFFDSIFMERTNDKVELLLKNYFNELKSFGLDYSYSCCSIWNSKKSQ
jgi:hypothetical protein